eukprot:CAMPEP_0195305044 /NCGR_PEP_ID=MMETSP0707-20130614/35584_1 /TAXON_ID=33640 /ORGANISM="Asterionellopsis glacialis, Strain CCMP134" /LENGTH=193 /DNA_ID=CAMNT_0040369049 /DNA_START=84 /DNA_END=662 /DNA_ORIENTATION=-
MKNFLSSKQVIDVLFVICCFIFLFDALHWLEEYLDQKLEERVITYNSMEVAPDDIHVFVTHEDGVLSIWDKEQHTIKVEVPVPLVKEGASFLVGNGLSFYNNTNENFHAFYSVFDQNHNESHVIKVDKFGSVAWVSAPLDGETLGAPDVSQDGHLIFLKHFNGGESGTLTILKGHDGNVRAYSELRTAATGSD